MKRAALFLLAFLPLLLINPILSRATSPGTSSNFTLVGQNPLFNRGMNAALAVFKNFIYIGNRTDGSSSCGVDLNGNPIPGNCPHVHPGVLIVNVQDPSNPAIVSEIGPPFAGNPGITTRELRVWPNKKLLIIMSFRGSPGLWGC